MMININTPITDKTIKKLRVGDIIEISGIIFTGRDAVLPKLVSLIKSGTLNTNQIPLNGSVIFHTAVSPAGVGPTSSNKLDIESSIPILCEAGVKIHIGKGKLSPSTIEHLNKHKSIYAVIPPVSALIKSRIQESKVLAFPEEGMEAMHQLHVISFPCMVAAAHGKTVN